MTDDRVFVSWGDGRKDREVRRTCNRCYGHGVSVREINVETVSKYGTAHAWAESEVGLTRCGIDATGDQWW